nr:ACP S-malonyltransferase [Snodgrassella alvi]
MSIAFFFPGQGSQSLNMMSGFNDMDIVKKTFEQASSALDQDLWALMNGDDAASLNETVNTQPLMLTAGVAVWRVYQQLNGQAPSVVAGHSLGEYTALVAAESLDFTDAVKLVRLRAQLMQNAVPQGQGAMAAILGLDDQIVRQVCAEAEQEVTGAVAEAVNYNSPGQIVIAGSTEAISRACELAKTAGAKRALLLPVSVPSHCRLMKPAAEQLSQALVNVKVNAPQITVLHNVDVSAHHDANSIKNALVQQLYSPVRWTETIETLVKEGITDYAECGPGKVLAGLAKRIDKNTICAALTSLESVENFITSHPVN